MIFLDSDVMISHLRGEARTTDALEALVAVGETLATTSVNVAELFHGAERATQREVALGQVLLLLDKLVQVPFGPRAARRFGGLMATLHKAGRPIPALDALIAATVLENGGRLLTRNARHFASVHGLDILPFDERS